MDIFKFESYKKFVITRIKAMPNSGRGEFQRLAKVLQMHTTTVSQVFKGCKELTLEQAAKLCLHWELNPKESNYFITLVELERAGSQELRRVLKARLSELKESSLELRNRISKDHTLDESERYRFYSEWYYSAIRLLCDVPGMNHVDHIAARLNLPLTTVKEVILFLLQTGLVREEGGELKLGPSRTFLDAGSPLVKRHHANWRLKAVSLHPYMKNEHELAVTSPMTLSLKDALRVREILMESIENILEINRPSTAESLYVLNVDWLSLYRTSNGG